MLHSPYISFVHSIYKCCLNINIYIHVNNSLLLLLFLFLGFYFIWGLFCLVLTRTWTRWWGLLARGIGTGWWWWWLARGWETGWVRCGRRARGFIQCYLRTTHSIESRWMGFIANCWRLRKGYSRGSYDEPTGLRGLDRWWSNL